MIELKIPGYRTLNLKHLVLDYNGTLAIDGKIVEGVPEILNALSTDLTIHVLTADTFGNVRESLAGVPCKLSILPPGDQDVGKLEYVRTLGAEQTVAVGNGRNDQKMLKESALGIAVILGEGASLEALLSADLVCTGIVAALELLRHPLRLTATLRS